MIQSNPKGVSSQGSVVTVLRTVRFSFRVKFQVQGKPPRGEVKFSPPSGRPRLSSGTLASFFAPCLPPRVLVFRSRTQVL